MKKITLTDLVTQQDLRPTDVVLDCGGYEGKYTEQIIDKVSKVFILEPVPEFYEKCVEKFKDNPKVSIFNIGLASYTGKQKLYIRGGSSSMYEGLADKYKSNHTKPTDIEVCRACNFFNSYRFDVLKFNCEGAEYSILNDIADLLPNFRELLIQFHKLKNIDYRPYNELLSKTHKKVFEQNDWEIWRKFQVQQ